MAETLAKAGEAFLSRAHSSASANQYFISFSANLARSRHIFSNVLKLRPRCSMTSYPPAPNLAQKNNAGNFSESKLNLKAAEEFFALAENSCCGATREVVQ